MSCLSKALGEHIIFGPDNVDLRDQSRQLAPFEAKGRHAVLREFGISAERIAAMTAAGIVQVAEDAHDAGT